MVIVINIILMSVIIANAIRDLLPTGVDGLQSSEWHF